VGYFWSGKHGRAVKGLCLVTLVYTDAKGVGLPVISEIICEWPKAICEWKGFSYDGNALSRLFGAKKSSWHPR
jgi:hypothetical protein